MMVNVWLWYRTRQRLDSDLVPDSSSLCFRLKYRWHKDKESSPVEHCLVQCLCLSHLSLFHWYYTGIDMIQEISDASPPGLVARPLEGSLWLLGESAGGFFRGRLWIFCGSTRWRTTSLSKTTVNKY